MSYDISITKTCPHCDHTEYLFKTGDTFNMYPVYKIIFDSDLGTKILNSMTVFEAKCTLNYAIQNMIKMESELIKMNPSNGYGSYDLSKEMLLNLRGECEKYSYQDDSIIVEVRW